MSGESTAQVAGEEMSFYLGMSDADIGRILGRAGSSIHTRRVSALSMLRKLMEER